MVNYAKGYAVLIRKREGTVLSIEARRPGVTEISVLLDGKEEAAINYDAITGSILPGDRVLLNTTAVFLGLGTGGYHFVCFNYRCPESEAPTPGHIMKMRYAPHQVKVCGYEELPGYREEITGFSGLHGMPVLIGELHSMIAPAAATIKKVDPDLRLCYIMTDSAALPLALSRSIHELKKTKIIDTAVTCGQAFGGDLEAVNVYSALVAACCIARADIALIAAGPGVVGTGTRFGFTGMEVGENVNRVHSLGGVPVVIPRISFADRRPRHRGISHHTLTALGITPIAPAFFPLPAMQKEAAGVVYSQLDSSGLWERHRVCTVINGGKYLSGHRGSLSLKSMNRDMEGDPYFFYASAAAGQLACILRSEKWEVGSGKKDYNNNNTICSSVIQETAT